MEGRPLVKVMKQAEEALVGLRVGEQAADPSPGQHIDPIKCHSLLDAVVLLLQLQQALVEADQKKEALRLACELEVERPNEWYDCWELLMDGLACQPDLLYYRQYKDLGQDGGGKQYVSLADNVFLAAVRCLLCHVLLQTDTATEVWRASARDMDYCRRWLLCVSATPVAQYTVRELLDAMQHLHKQWPMLPYDHQLVDYIELLMLALARHLTYAHDQLVQSVDDYRVQARPADVEDSSGGASAGGGESAASTGAPDGLLFTGNALCVRTYAAIVGTMWRDVFIYRLFQGSGPADLPSGVTPERVKAAREWLDSAPTSLGMEERSQWLVDMYPQQMLWPGEQMLYRLHENVVVMPPVRTVLTKRRGQTMQPLLTLSSRPGKHIREQLVKQGRAGELLGRLLDAECVRVALYQLCNHLAGEDVMSHTPEQLLARYQEQRRAGWTAMPYLVNTFHYYAVWAAGRFYPCGVEIERALVCWLELSTHESDTAGLRNAVYSLVPTPLDPDAGEPGQRRRLGGEEEEERNRREEDASLHPDQEDDWRRRIRQLSHINLSVTRPGKK